MVGVGAQRGTVQRSGANDEPVVALLGVPAQEADLGGQGRQTVGLVPAQVRDAGEGAGVALRPGKRGQGRYRGGQLADVGQVRVDPGQPPGAVGREQSVGECHLPAQAGEELAPGVTGLGRGRRPVGDADPATGHEGGRQEGTCVGQVRLDDHLPAAGTTGVDPPGALAVTGPEGGLVHGDAPLAQRRHCHAHVRQ